jgi:hypothetical protein
MEALLGCRIIGAGQADDEAYIDVEDEMRSGKFRVYFDVFNDRSLQVEIVPWVPRPPERKPA